MPKKQTSKNKKTHFGLARCPYCDSKVSYFTSFFDRDDGEYTCESCGETSNIYFVKKINIAVIVVSLLSIITFVLYFFFGDKSSVLGIILVFTPYFIFFASTPLFFRLSPMEETPKPREKKISSAYSKEQNKATERKKQPQSKRHIIINEEKPKTSPRSASKSYSEEEDFFENYEKRAEQRRKLAAERERISQRGDDIRSYERSQKSRAYPNVSGASTSNKGSLSEYEGATRIRSAVTSDDIKNKKNKKISESEKNKSRYDILSQYEMAAEQIERKSDYELQLQRRQSVQNFDRDIKIRQKPVDYERTVQRREPAPEYERKVQRREAQSEYDREALRRKALEEYEKSVKRREVNADYSKTSSDYDGYGVRKTSNYADNYKSRVTENDERVYSPEKRKPASDDLRQRERTLTIEQRRAIAQRQARAQAQQKKSSADSYSRLNMNDFDDFD